MIGGFKMETVAIWYAEVKNTQYAIMAEDRDVLPADATYVRQMTITTDYLPGMEVSAYAEALAAMNPGWTIDVDGWGRHSEHGPYEA